MTGLFVARFLDWLASWVHIEYRDFECGDRFGRAVGEGFKMSERWEQRGR